MNKHAVIAGALFTILSLMGFVLAVFAFLSMLDKEGGSTLLTSIEGLGILVYIALVALPGAFAGFGLLFGYKWGREVALLLAAMSLIFFPLGTIFVIYVIWGLTREDNKVRTGFQSYAH